MQEYSQQLVYMLNNQPAIHENSIYTNVGLQIGLFVVLIFLLILSAIISGTETAYTTIGLAKINNMVEKRARGAKLILKHYKHFNQILSTILLFNNMVNIGSSTLTSYILGIWMSNNSDLIPIISTVALTPVLVIFGEIVPKIIAKSHPFVYLQIFVYFIHFLYLISFPFTFLISKLGKKVYVTNSEEEIKSILDIANEEGVLETNESLLTQNALDLDSVKVSTHYIRLRDVTAVPYNYSVEKTLEVFEKTQYSRIPIIKNKQLIGIVHLKDIFNKKTGKVINYLKTVPTISSNISLSSALDKLRLNRAQMAFVTKNNSTPQVIGIITLEDILEELVGEIYDEYDNDEEIYEISLQKARAKGNVELKTILKQLEIENDATEEELIMTLEEWLECKLGHNLHKNDRYEWEERVVFKVLETRKQKIPSIIEINIL